VSVSQEKKAGFQLFLQGVYVPSAEQAIHQLMLSLDVDHYEIYIIPCDGESTSIVRINDGEFRGNYDVEYSLQKGELLLLEDIH
jgi:hypothetical protein